MRNVFFGLVAVFMGVAGAGVQAGAPLALRAGSLSIQLDPQTGAILSGGGALGRCADRYVWFSAKQEREGSESRDEVTSVQTAEDGKMTLVCRNAATGLTITKQYSLAGHPMILSKRISFTGPEGFVRYDADVAATADFRNGAYYHKPSWHTAAAPRIAADEVRKETRIDSGGWNFICLVSPQRRQTLAGYRYAVDDHPVFPYGGTGEGGLWYTPTGWRVTAFTGATGPGKTPSITVRYEIRPGDEYDFHLDLSHRPEIEAVRGPEPAGWATEIAMEGGWDDRYAADLDHLKKVLDRLPWGYLCWNHWGWFAPYYGDYASRKEDTAPGTRDPAEVTKLYARVRKISPKIKIGCYVLPGAVNAGSRFAKDHPEWLVRDSSGQPYKGCFADYAPKDPTYLYQAALPDVIAWWRDRIEGMVTRLGADYVYIDGGTGGQAIPDWPRKFVAQDYDWYKLWRMFQSIPQEHGGLLWSNYPIGVYSDAGYHECNWYPMYVNDWKVMTDRLVFSRVYSRPGRPLGMAGFVWNGKPDHPATRLQIDWWFLHGLTPVFLDIKGEFHVPAMESDLPYIAAAYQLRRRELVQAHVSPRWQDDDSEVEVHAQKIPGAGLLSIMSHADEAKQFPVEADLAPLGIKPGRPLYVWHLALKPFAKLGSTLAGPARLPACFDARLLKVIAKAPKRLKIELDLPPELTQLVVLTASPAVVASVGGQECPVLLPQTLGMTTAGVADPETGNVDLMVRTAVAGEILIPLPDQLGTRVVGTIHPTGGAVGSGVCEGSKPLPVRIETRGGRSMARVAVPAYDCEIALRKGN